MGVNRWGVGTGDWEGGRKRGVTTAGRDEVVGKFLSPLAHITSYFPVAGRTMEKEKISCQLVPQLQQTVTCTVVKLSW